MMRWSNMYLTHATYSLLCLLLLHVSALCLGKIRYHAIPNKSMVGRDPWPLCWPSLHTSRLHPEDETNAAAGRAPAASLPGWERLPEDVLYDVRPGGRQVWPVLHQRQSPPVVRQMPQRVQRRPRERELPEQGLRGGCTQRQHRRPQPGGKRRWWLQVCTLSFLFLFYIAHWVFRWFL